MKFACQLLVLLLMVVGFFDMLWTDFHGRSRQEPFGFIGAITSVILTFITLVVMTKAGAFSLLW